MNQPRPAVKTHPDTQLMEKVVQKENMLLAWKRVERNRGSPGVDARTIKDTWNYLKTQWDSIRKSLLLGGYVPQAVRKVMIPKPNGGMRQLGIPTVLDRLIQQAILQILQPIFDPTFHPQSYGFRPRRNAHQAIRQVQQFIGEGRHYCVDVDIEKFFDRVNHDILMDRIQKRIKDTRLIRIIQRYLKAGMMDEGVCRQREEGTPQGGPLSPLLSNLLLDEIDWELEERGLAFVRYADDCNVYVNSKVAAQKAKRTLVKLLGNLRLRVNSEKTYVGKVFGTRRKFLGYSMSQAKADGHIKPRISDSAVNKLKEKVRKITSRSIGRNIAEHVENTINPVLRGWKNYFSLAEDGRLLNQLDSWIRRRLRAIQLKQWRRGGTCYRELVSRGLPQKDAAKVSAHLRNYWKASQYIGMHLVFNNEYYKTLGLISLGN
jgi:RNA-directed DNA polymerase